VGERTFVLVFSHEKSIFTSMIDLIGYIGREDIVMRKSKSAVDPIPKQFFQFNELANFWETHDLTDYEDQLQEVKSKIAKAPIRRFVVTLSDELTKELRKAVQREGVSMQTLINLWVQERLRQYRAL
jgi:hypothetical protein